MAIQATFIILIGWILSLSFTFVMSSDCPNGFTLIDFEQINNSSDSPIPVKYHNLEWTNGGVLKSSTNPHSGYLTALISGQSVAYNMHGKPMSISVGLNNSFSTFSVSSFVAAAAWNNDLILSISGERSGRIVYNKTVTLHTKRATTIVLDWNSIDKISFITSGGNPVGLNGTGTHFAMDNLCMTTGSIGRPDLLYKCDYWGDPQLIQFPKIANQRVTSTWCRITGSSVLYQSPYVLINVVNSGSADGDIITAFDITLYSLSMVPLCTLTQSDMTGTARSCGLDVNIAKSGSDMNIAYKKATFSVWIKYSSWRGGHYKFTLFTTLKNINANTTNGMCVKGCSNFRTTPEMIITDSTTDTEIVTSALAHEICDRFIKEATRKSLGHNILGETTPGYTDAIRQACFIDLTVTGNIEFAEQGVANIITDMLTNNGQIKIEEMGNLIQNTTIIAQKTIKEAEIHIETIIKGATWPCKPDSPICIMPFNLRRKLIYNH